MITCSRIFLTAITLLLVSSCAFTQGKSTRVILRHPETIDFVNCNVDAWQSAKSYQENEKCIEDYKKKGYVVWASK